MQKSKFSSKNRISKIQVFETRELLISAKDFISIATDYLEKNFKGIVNIKSSKATSKQIKISPAKLVDLLKRLVYHSKLEKLINVNIYCDYDKFFIVVFYDDGTKFERTFEREIVRYSRSFGLEAKRLENGIIFSKDVARSDTLSVFTNLFESEKLERLFEDIFSDM